MKAIITVGISASGKSTYANKLVKDGWVKVERDEIRRQLFRFKQWSEYRFTRAKENRVTEVAQDMMANTADSGENLVISDTNLNIDRRLHLEQYLEGLGYDVEVKYFDVSLKEAYKRDQSREVSVGRDVIYKQYQQYLKDTGRKTYHKTGKKPKAIVVDVDGTLARMVDRGPFEWDKVSQDAVRPFIVDMVKSVAETEGYDVVILSGRDSVCRADTKEWLKEHLQMPFTLYVRSEGDMRPDTIIKEELFWSDVAKQWDVEAVIDDRPCMIRLWYELGIENVISVADPYVEF